MRVTVITAVLNAREGLIKTRDSVLAQQGVDVQHVVIDGGSTDGAVSLLRDWEQRDGVSFLSESDSGVYEAFNKGLRLASGEIIGFLNAGDVFSDETVLSDVASALASPDIDLVYGDVDITHPNSIDRVVRRYRARGFLPSQLLRGFMPPHPSIYA